MTDIKVQESPMMIRVLAWYAIFGCVIFVVAILIADVVVPDHDWIADTISDLGAGKFEFIVDIGIYAFSGSLIAVALLLSHVHLGGRRWSFAIIGFAVLGLVVFLVGARNEYGDSDNEGIVIHRYLVYAIGALMTVLPLALSAGVARIGESYRYVMIGMSVLWTLSAPVFFFMPTDVDGVYERYLGLVAMAVVCTVAVLFIRRARATAQT